MRIVGINGSPRQEWNTAQMLEKALAGAASAGMETDMFHLYDLDFTGCTSCFACKVPGGKSYGRCAVRDGLAPVLEEIRDADALVIGSPIYLFDASGETRSFFERLVFQSLLYTSPPSSLVSRKIRTALVYTMNVTDETVSATGLDKVLEMSRAMLERTFGSCELLLATDTMQFADYAKYQIEYFDPAAKKKRHEEVFPVDLERAFELGKRLAAPLL